MTNEEFLEEILIEAHQLGIFKMVIELQSTFEEPNSLSSFQKAIDQITSQQQISTT